MTRAFASWVIRRPLSAQQPLGSLLRVLFKGSSNGPRGLEGFYKDWDRGLFWMFWDPHSSARTTKAELKVSRGLELTTGCSRVLEPLRIPVKVYFFLFPRQQMPENRNNPHVGMAIQRNRRNNSRIQKGKQQTNRSTPYQGIGLAMSDLRSSTSERRGLRSGLKSSRVRVCRA